MPCVRAAPTDTPCVGGPVPTIGIGARVVQDIIHLRSFRTLADLFDSTEQIHDFEYSGVCMLAADEPASVEHALEQDCWRRAMEEEMSSIKQNKT
jgi:hypothetical protein